MVMVYVPAGEFLMGRPDSDTEADSNEKPEHTVYLAAFWIDRTEVTNAQYRQCVQAGACQPPSSNASYSRDSYYDNSSFDNHPVIYVDWSQANAYCRWAGARLPSEAEWEKAARGTGDWRKYPWGGESPSCSLTNYCPTSHLPCCVGDTTKVGRYPTDASPYGALDMGGNLDEWVADWYDRGYYAYSPADNPKGPDSGEARVARGGTWACDWFCARTTSRWARPPTKSHYATGFRCASSPEG